MPRKIKATPQVLELRQKIKEKLKQGLSRRQIEREANLPHGTISNFLTRYSGTSKNQKVLKRIEQYLQEPFIKTPEMDQIARKLVFFKERAIAGKHFQTFSFIFLIVSLLLYVLIGSQWLKVAVITGCVSVLISIFYLSFLIDPLWKKEIEKYKEATENFFKK